MRTKIILAIVVIAFAVGSAACRVGNYDCQVHGSSLVVCTYIPPNVSGAYLPTGH